MSNESGFSLEKNPALIEEVEALAGEYDRIIFFCRSGVRSYALSTEVYEINQPDGQRDIAMSTRTTAAYC